MLLKKSAIFVAGLSLLAARSLLAEDAPRGNLIELHSCELYAGGCKVSSESTLGGRQMLQVWDVANGSWQGTGLGGLQAAVLYLSSDNLAEAGTRAQNAVVYLPESAKPVQRQALLSWLKSSEPALAAAGRINTRIVALSFARTDAGVTFSAGNFASLKTISLQTCSMAGCGEDLWYSPRSQTTAFTVAVDAASQVAEPLMNLKWNDNGTRSVFVGRFGEASAARNLFVQSTEWCGASGRLF